MLKRYVTFSIITRRKLAVRSIKRTLLRRNRPDNGEAESDNCRRRQQAVSRTWKCDTVLLRRKGDGMSTQYLQELGRSHIVSKAESWNIAEVQSSGGITHRGKAETMRCEKSEEAIVPMMSETTQLWLGKGLYFDRASNGGKC